MRRSVAIFIMLTLCVLSRALSAEPIAPIQSMIDQAGDHERVVIPPGNYEGRLKIMHPVVIDGQGKVTIDGGEEGSVIEITSPDVTIRGLHITGSGQRVSDEQAGIKSVAGPVTIEDNVLEDVYFGIDLKQAPGSVIRNNTISGKDLEIGRRGDGIRLWWSHNCQITGNAVHSLRDMVFWYSEDLHISHNTVTDSRYGLHFMYSHNTVIEENDLARNSVGIYLMYSNNIHLLRNQIYNNRGSSGYGIGLKDDDAIVVEDNDLLANRVGLYIDNSPSSIDSVGLVKGNRIAFNEVGLLATPNTHDNVITENAFIENEEQVTVHGGGQLSLNTFASEGRGNFWSDYNGFDQNHDGIGDFPHAPSSLFRTLLARDPNLRLFVHSPAQQAVELTARAFPEISPKPMFTDPAPLASVPVFKDGGDAARSFPMPMAALALGLLAVAAGAIWRLAGHDPCRHIWAQSSPHIKQKVQA
ncbi:MAG: nitrous oxide reductase family maturation protein NosD [Phycisphaerales bacterium]|nr:nitrous oxide reductase family maturation protein NosD [Phycisphaerales bacterium]